MGGRSPRRHVPWPGRAPGQGWGSQFLKGNPGCLVGMPASAAEINNGPLTSGGPGEGGRQGGGETGEVTQAVRGEGRPLNQQHEVTPAEGSFHSSSLT